MDEKLKYALKNGLIGGALYGLGLAWWYDDPFRGVAAGIPFTIFMIGLFWFQKRSEEKKEK